MSDDAKPAQVPLEMEEARVFLLGGQQLTITVPVEPGAYSNWLKVVKADGIIVGGMTGEIVISVAHVTCIVKGEALRNMVSGFGFPAMPASGFGRPN